MTLAGFKRINIRSDSSIKLNLRLPSKYRISYWFGMSVTRISYLESAKDIQNVWFWYITMPNFSSRSILSEASSRIISWSSSVFYKISQALKTESFIDADSKEIWYTAIIFQLAMETFPLFEGLLFVLNKAQVQS